MGKRSDYKRRARDAYFTPYKCILPLLPHLEKGSTFCEPAAGDGRLIDHLEKHGHKCIKAFDIEPKRDDITQADALEVDPSFLMGSDYIISNVPWAREILHPMIEKFAGIAPFWSLHDSDWKDTIQAAPYLEYCEKIVSIGRVSWMDNGVSGVDNASFYLFDKEFKGQTQFFGRQKKK